MKEKQIKNKRMKKQKEGVGETIGKDDIELRTNRREYW